MVTTPELWVLLSFVLFVALLVYYEIPSKVVKALDDRAEQIRSELFEARRLRDEAQSILMDYQRKRLEAEKEAQDIVATAKRDAEAYAAEQRKAMTETLQRRMRLAEEKITRAEEQAIHDIRSRAADVAISAAEIVIARKLKGKSAKNLVEKSVKDVGSKLN
jgi:F-type H+-transporting ATPase subunit b